MLLFLDVLGFQELILGWDLKQGLRNTQLLHRGFWGKMSAVACFKFYSLCGSKTEAAYLEDFLVREFVKDFLNLEFLKD